MSAGNHSSWGRPVRQEVSKGLFGTRHRALKNALVVAVSCGFFGLNSVHSMPAPGRSTPYPDDGALDLSYSFHSGRTQVQGPSLEIETSGSANFTGDHAYPASIATANAENLPIPVASHWGLVIMGLLLLTLAKIRSWDWQGE